MLILDHRLTAVPSLDDHGKARSTAAIARATGPPQGPSMRAVSNRAAHLASDYDPRELPSELLCIAAGIELNKDHSLVAAAR